MSDRPSRAMRLRQFAIRSVDRHGHPESPERSMDPRPERVVPDAGSLVDCAIYVDGHRLHSPQTLVDTYRALRDEPQGMAWIGLYRPDEEQLLFLAQQFGLHELAVEDAIVEVDFGELHVFVGRDFVITVRRSETPDLAGVRRRMESDPELLARGPEAVLYAIFDAVVDGYAPVVAGLQNDIEEIEAEVFLGEAGVSRRIYELSREVVEFQRATRPLMRIPDALVAGFEKYDIDEELRSYLRDVTDHLTTVVERVDGFRLMLQDILTVNATLVTQAQNEEMKAQNEEVKKISAWAAILFAPTLIGTVYGMNFRRMPELRWYYGYPFALALMAAVCGALYLAFKRRRWL